MSNENKAFIWQLLMEANAFNNISNNNFQKINLSYETMMNEISKTKELSLIEKNKLLMSKMLVYLNLCHTVVDSTCLSNMNKLMIHKKHKKC